MARRYFNPRRNRFNFRPREIKGFVLVCLLVVVMTRPEGGSPNSLSWAYFFSNTGW